MAQYEKLKSQLNVSEMKSALDQLKPVQLWGAINQVHPLLEGAWFVDADAGNGIIISRKAANEQLSDEAIRLGTLQPNGYLAYPANKSMDIVLLDNPLMRNNWLDLLNRPG